MRITIRDIIVDALAEAGLVNRNQPAPADLIVGSFSLLKKRIDSYSNTNYLEFLRKEVDIELKKEATVIGSRELSEDYVYGSNYIEVNNINMLPDPSAESFEIYKGTAIHDKSDDNIYEMKEYKEGHWSNYTYEVIGTYDNWSGFAVIPDIEVNNLQEVYRLFKENDQLQFVSYEDFYGFNNPDVYTVLPYDDQHVKLFVNKVLIGKTVKMIYNEKFEFDIDSELRIPNQFVSLFSAGLVYDLSVAYPRLSDTTIALLKDRVTELEANVRRSSSVNKFIRRDTKVSSTSFFTGAFLNI